MMRFGEIPGVRKPVSRIIQGTMMLDPERLDEAFELCDVALEAGINTFDTAHVYGGGGCERVLGAWIADRGVREKVVIIDKGAHHNADRPRLHDFDITSDLYDCLARLKTDYIDLFLLHRDDPDMPVGRIVEALHRHREAGLIRAYGGSNWTAHRIEQANEYAAANGLIPFVASSPNFSLAEQLEPIWEGCVSIAGPRNRDEMAWYKRSQMPVLSWSTLGRGFLSGAWTRDLLLDFPEDGDEALLRCYLSEENLERLDRCRELASRKGHFVAQIALAWVLAQPIDVFVLVGAKTPWEIGANVGALEVDLTEEELLWLNLG